jgi:BirA family biotin operon repressor/biotin-[acetyl-CoA-carboxylase] ligase
MSPGMSHKEAILTAFLQAEGRYLSGQALGEQLTLSRVGVHKHLDNLRKEGFSFHAVRNKGYRLEKEPLDLNPSLINCLLAADPVPFFHSHTFCESIDSTNTEADRQLARGVTTPFTVVSTEQTAGRGRRGRTWFSPKGKNIYLTAALNPGLPPNRLQVITLWLGLSLAQALRERYSLPILVKWPNDLLLHDRKIAGMLTEARVDSERTESLVFGIGLNVNIAREDFPDELQSRASSLAAVLGEPLSLSRVTVFLLRTLAAALEDFLADEYRDQLKHLWPTYDALAGREVTSEFASGRVLGINPQGSLRLQRPDGSLALLHAGEVSLQRTE